MDVTAHLKEIIILVDHPRLVALLEYMAGSSVALVEIYRVTGLKRLHHLGKIPLRRLHQQMDVIGQQAVRQKIDVFLLAVKGQFLQVSLSVSVIAEDCLAVIAPANNMINRSGVFDAHGSRHEGNHIDKDQKAMDSSIDSAEKPPF